MSQELHLLVNVAVAVAVALVGGLLAHALRQPVIVGYLLAGVVIGPFTPGFTGDREQIASLAEVGVIFLMFALGIEFTLADLARVRNVALIGTSVQVLLTIGAGVALGVVLGWPFGQGLFFGGVIAISSTMVVLKMLLERGEVGSRHGQVLLGMLIVQDLATVLLIVLLPRLAGGAGIDLFDIGLLYEYFGTYCGQSNISFEQFVALGRRQGAGPRIERGFGTAGTAGPAQSRGCAQRGRRSASRARCSNVGRTSS